MAFPSKRSLIAVSLWIACSACDAEKPATISQTSPIVEDAGAAAALHPPDTFDVAAIDDYVTRRLTNKGLIGLSLAIMKDGKIVLAKGYGQSSREPAIAVDTDTAFAIGSITKQFTCASALLLAEDKKLSLDDKVAKYYPDLTRAKDISLYDLGGHVSGYADYYPLDFIDRRMQKPIVPDTLIAEYAGRKLDFEPRTLWSYSNTGFVLLGRIVEKVSGQPFGEFLEQRIAKIAGMEHTSFAPKEDTKGLAKGYTSFALGEPEPAEREADGWTHAAGAIYASATDLARWDLALMAGKILKPESYRLMTTAHTLPEGRATRYGCGLGLGLIRGDIVLQHNGAVSGFLAYNLMAPRTKSAVVLLSNRDDIDARSLFDEITDLLMKDQGSVPKIQGPIPKEIARTLVTQMQSGTIDRSLLGEEFSVFLSDARLKAAVDRLKALGEPTEIEVDNVSERGGMEVAQVRLTFKSAKLKASLYRTPDGKVQQFLLHKG